MLGISLGGLTLKPGAVAADPYGPELIQNGTFDDTSNWTMAGAIPPAISGGQLVWTAGNGFSSTATNTPTASPEAGATYRVTYTVTSYTNGSVRIQVGGTFTTSRTAAGTYTENVVAASTAAPRALAFTNPSTLSIDNLSVKKVL